MSDYKKLPDCFPTWLHCPVFPLAEYEGDLVHLSSSLGPFWSYIGSVAAERLVADNQVNVT